MEKNINYISTYSSSLNTDEFKEEFRKSLPIYSHREDILKVIKENPFCIITGETGSGKTTQIPQYIIESIRRGDLVGPNGEGMVDEDVKESEEVPRIVITQPRRVAAIQMAKRVAYEKNYKLGEEVGYSIRFEDCSSKKTIIKFVTDGILVRECLVDRDLSRYSVIMLDEAHERSLYTDILFALAKQAVKRRNGTLKLIITSATLDTEQFRNYFDNCPILKISGKLFPVDIIYQSERMEKRVDASVQLAIRIHLHEGPGHILAFLTGFEECEQACKLCYSILEELVTKGKKVPPMIIMPLYGAQNTEDQAKVFEKAPDNCRKMIFSTNIAETSLTVDGIGFVIDCGYVKQKIYNHKTSMDSLMVVPISKVQAIQRSGRAGRTGPGKCIRLYSDQFFKNQMAEVTIAEILRVNLSSTILTLKTMGIEDVVDFDFMEKPEKDSILEALKELYFLQAIDSTGKITKLGLEMSKFPLDCCYSRGLIASKYFNVLEEMTTLVSLISCESVWYNVNKYDEDRRAYFEKKKTEFIDKFSDHMTFLNIFKEWEFNEYSEDWCKQNFLHFRALKQSRNIKMQISEYMNKVNFRECEKFFNIKTINYLLEEVDCDTTLDDYEKVNCLLRMALCQGFYMNAARKMANSNEGLNYLRISDGSVVTLDQFSSIAIKEMRPDLVIYTELGGTNSKAVMKQASVIELKWISDLLIFIKNVDVNNLKGSHKSPQRANNNNPGKEIDLYAIIDRNRRDPTVLEEEVVDDSEEMKKKSQEAKERYLQRKTKRKENKN